MNPKQAARLGALLRTRRTELGMSTRVLAGRCRPPMDMATVVRVERGQFAAPRPDTLRALAEVLELPLADLFTLADYVVPGELPTPKPYLRAKYPQLPEEALARAEAYLQRAIARHSTPATIQPTTPAKTPRPVSPDRKAGRRGGKATG